MELNEYEKEHLEILREHLAECTVLLKSNGDFPLDAPCKIAAYGAGVRGTVRGGTGSGEVNSRYAVTVEEGLKKAGFTVTTESWLTGYEEVRAKAKKEFIKQVKAEAKAAKVNPAIFGMGRTMPDPEYQLPLEGEGAVAIYVLSRISGEGNDRKPESGDIKLTATEKRDILTLNKRYGKFMLVLNVGGMVDLSEVQEVENILLLSQLGVETGDALADILLGKANPSGKLTTTWSAWEDYAPMEDFGDHNDTRYWEGIYVGYRYFDSFGKKAMYPFGYGLSYTTFEQRTGAVTLDGTKVTVKTVVTNTGSRSGKEVVQVYVSAPDGSLDKPYQDLAAFGKTKLLQPGETETLTVCFDMKDLASFDETAAAWVLEQGRYVVRVGNSSIDTQIAAVIKLDADATVKKVRSAFGTVDFVDRKPDKTAEPVIPEGVPTLMLDAAAVLTEEIEYEKEYPIEETVKQLSDEQLIYAGIGEFDPKASVLSVIGNASQLVAGAAGETTSVLAEHGFKKLIMADGPAGLRLSPQFYRDEKGAHALGQSAIPESIVEFLPTPVRWLMSLLGGGAKVPKGKTVQYQYCTAIPIGTALAQSWNLDFARECGDIVGAEMEHFGIHLWLAPALNIHRSVRCGRNFEYYSEDPLVSGKFAAAVTSGVQSHPGCGTTIKHYAANNQETNRYGNNSIISQRALREIYLKGFGICVRESQPAAVMTSYNLLNGQHTAERRDLTEDVLRCEFGFEGIVMSDWVAAGSIMSSKDDIHPTVKPRLAAAAGGDLFMPGCKRDFDDMMQGLQNGDLTRQQLQINATRVYRMAQKLNQK